MTDRTVSESLRLLKERGLMVRQSKRGFRILRRDGLAMVAGGGKTRHFPSLSEAVRAALGVPAATGADAALAADIATYGAAGKPWQAAPDAPASVTYAAPAPAPLPATAGQASDMLQHTAFMVEAADAHVRAAYLVALFGSHRGMAIASAMAGGTGFLAAVWDTHTTE